MIRFIHNFIRTKRNSLRRSFTAKAAEKKVASANRLKYVFPSKITSDCVGPPDCDSNMRIMKFYVPPNETELEKEYRLMREDTQNWHHEFWSTQNRNFFQQKHEFLKQREADNYSNKDGDGESSVVSAEELSKFYRHFLDDNYELHHNYNREWYRRNIHLLWLAAKVDFYRLIKWREKPRPS